MLIDNTKNLSKCFSSEANKNLVSFKGNVFIIAHQDVFFADEKWFEKAQSILKDVEFGVVGVAGITKDGKKWGNMKYGYWEYPIPDEPLKEVETLDEQLLIIPKKVFEKVKFDEKTFDGWHLYGADYCLQVKKKFGLKSYVINLPVIHNTSRANIKDFLKYARRLLNKYPEYRKIPTTSGIITKDWLKYREKIEGIEPFYRRIFQGVEEFIRSKISGKTLLITYNRYIKYTIDTPFHHFPLFKPSMENKFIQRKNFPSGKYDTVILMDILQMLSEVEQKILLGKIEEIGKKLIIIEKNTQKIYKLLMDSGYILHPLGGWKILRGENGEARFPPRFLFRILGDGLEKFLDMGNASYIIGGEKVIK